MFSILAKFCEDESGATAIEYGLIAALIVLAMLAGLQGVADETSNMWTGISDSMATAMEKAR
ncbi:Flp family type IVb pilin [Croceicoccus ponticola]|uniref:Flp family type IVb pilin n=1 Tax=Croceicoccus ponticola TaxID=2217664 RepID=A0A437GUQ7_9SPHN|nr:Flp family type IVb pilin [Croceicoccus ponticola]RVQ65287.1 Flp family type IVb pilin [Croceicoccus ponticola]